MSASGGQTTNHCVDVSASGDQNTNLGVDVSASGGQTTNLGVDVSASSVENDQLCQSIKVALVWVGHCTEQRMENVSICLKCVEIFAIF